MTLTERLQKVLDLQPGESRPVAAMTAYFMLLIFAFLVGRTVRDALFLANFGMDYLPWMYIGTAVTVSFSSQIYSRLAPKINPKLLGYLSVISFAIVFVLFRFIVTGNGSLATYAALYLWVEVFGALALLEFWNLAGEVFDQRQAKRLYGLVSAGQVVSNILCGALSSTLSKSWGAENLLWLSGGSLLLILPLVFWVGRFRSGKRSAKKAPPKLDKRDPAYAKHIGYLQTIAAVIVLTYLSTSVIDFQFKLAAKAAFPGKDDLARYFGIFYAAVGTVGFFLQTFFTGRITKALGVLETLAIMPGFFLVGAISQVFAPGLATATATKFSENTLRYSINDPVTQLLYLPLPSNFRLRALALASGTIKPWSMGGAGLLMLAIRPYASSAPAVFSWVVFLLCAGWLALLIRLKRGYLGAVATGAEEGRRLVWTRQRLDPNDPLVQESLLRTLREGNPEKIDYALSLAEKVDIEGLEDCLRECLKKSGPARARVLQTLEARRDQAFEADIRFCVASNDPPVSRAAAYRALAAVEGEKAIPVLRKGLSDPSQIIRAGAIEGLARYCGSKGLSMALVALDSLLAASDPVARVLAVRVIAHSNIPHPFQLLEPLLEDADVDVVREAIRACGARCDEEAVPSLLKGLANPATASVAAEAIAKFGAPIVEELRAFLQNGDQPLAVREAAMKALSHNSSREAGDCIVNVLAGLPWALRVSGAIALQRKVRQATWSPGDAAREKLTAACLAQIDEAAWYRCVRELLRKRDDILEQSLVEKVVACELQALRLAAVLRPAEELVVLVRAGVLADSFKRQLLVEICDNVLSGEIKDRLPLFLEGNDPQRTQTFADRHAVIPLNAVEARRSLANRSDMWLRNCAVWAAVKENDHELLSSIPGAQAMADVVEKVLLLKSATLFNHLTGADIEKIASIAQECSFAAEQPVFEQGDPGDALYIVTKGQVKVHVGEKQFALLKERDCFGEMAILDDQPRSASITAVSDVQCLALRRDDFFFLLEDHFEIVKSIIRVLTERLRNANIAQSAPPPPAAGAPAKN